LGDELEPVFTDIAKRFHNLNKGRNDLFHGVTFVGWGSNQTEDWSEFAAFKISSNKTGHYVQELPKTPADLESWSLEAREISELIWRYNHWCVVKRLEPKRQFAHVDGHWRCATESERVPGARLKIVTNPSWNYRGR
jgi:hypothetical protein